jgi:hypothetical protein
MTTTETKKVVHILKHGFAICGFTRNVPALWPAGHVWVGFEWANAAALATCTECREQGRCKHDVNPATDRCVFCGKNRFQRENEC